MSESRITKTHTEDKEICSKYESEVMTKSGKGKEVQGFHHNHRKGEILVDMSGKHDRWCKHDAVCSCVHAVVLKWFGSSSAWLHCLGLPWSHGSVRDGKHQAIILSQLPVLFCFK